MSHSPASAPGSSRIPRPRRWSFHPSALCAAVGLALVSSSPGNATTIHVPPDVATVAAGLAAASAGDTVEVACGTYFESALVLKSGVVLQSETRHPECVTIDGEGEKRLFSGFDLSSSTKVVGITFTHGWSTNGYYLQAVGPGRIPSGEPNPEPPGVGGTTDRGGGAGGYLGNSDVRFEDCVWIANEAFIHGGALRIQGGAPSFTRCRIEANTSRWTAGGMYVGGEADVSLADCVVRANEALYGAGLYVAYSRVSAEEVDVLENRAERVGGGVSAVASDLQWSGSLLSDNSTDPGGTNRGGAVSCRGGTSGFNGCTFAGNGSPRGSAVHASSATISIGESIVAFNTGAAEPLGSDSGFFTVTCSDLYGNQAEPGALAGRGSESSFGSDNISSDPLFCDLDFHDYGLREGSPCLPENNACQVQIGARGLGCGLEGGVLVRTEPPGLEVLVDGQTHVSPALFDWVPGTIHSLGVDSPQEMIEGARHSFASWSDGGAILHDVVAPESTTTFTAFFDSEYYLTIAISGNGTAVPASGWHASGEVVPISATPEGEWVFAEWVGEGNGSYSGPDNPAAVTMRGPVTETARFDFDGDYLLTMVPESGGAVTPETGYHHAGDEVPIEAVPDVGHHFAGWSGFGQGSYSGTDNPASVTMLSDILQVAGFGPDVVNLVTAALGEGTVTPPSGSDFYRDLVTLGAVPDPGWVFLTWAGTGPGSYTGPDPAPQIEMLGDIHETAIFQLGTFDLTMVAGEGGNVTPESGEYSGGTSVQITAVADSAWEFVRWEGTGSGSYSGPQNPASVWMVSDITEAAVFLPIGVRTLTMDVGSGNGTVTPPGGDYPRYSEVTIEAVPAPGWAFTGWTGSGSGSYTGYDNPAVVTMLEDVHQWALFDSAAIATITITTSPPGYPMVVDGDSTVSPATYIWAEGTHHEFSVPASQVADSTHRSVFTQWDDGVVFPNRGINTPGEDHTYTAFYDAEVFLRFADPLEGTSSPGDGWHTVGEAVTIHAHGIGTYAFSSWSGQGSGSYTGLDNPATVTMNEPIVQTPSFVPFGHEFSISASDTDPFVNEASPAGGVRSLYLWGTCLEQGLAALQASVVTDLPVLAFTPSPGILNAGSATDLLLAVGGCPAGEDADRLLGTWIVEDSGGDFCLGDTGPDPFASVDCVDGDPSLVVHPRLVGFSSSGNGPCLVEENPCRHLGGFDAAVRIVAGDRALEIGVQPASGRAHDGWHLFRSTGAGAPFTRVTHEPVAGGLRAAYRDEGVEASRNYVYKLMEVVDGRPGASSGEISARTPEWAPAFTSFSGAHPNPFGGGTLFRFALATRAHVRLEVYDVTGRRVSRVLDESRDPGYWEAPWDGRDGGGLRVSSGVYFVRFEAGDYRSTRKIVRLGGR